MENLDTNILDDDRINMLLLKLSIPAFVGMFIMTLYNVVDTIFIGRYVGAIGIAAISIVFPIQMLAMGTGHMMGMGGASLISRLIGANDIKKAECALGNATSGAFILSAMIVLFGLTQSDLCLTYMGATDTILPYAKIYMRIIIIGMFFQTFAMMANALIRSEGNARVPMIGMVIGAILNIILDAVFIVSLKMGIGGAALGTVISQMMTVLYFGLYYFGGKSYLKFHVKNLMIEWPVIRDILAIGVAAFAMTVSGSISAIFTNRFCIEYGGDMAVSAFGIANRLMMFALMPAIVIGQGLQPIIGFNYGAARYERILKALKISSAYATCFCAVSFVCLYFCPEPFIKIFTKDQMLIATGRHAAKYMFSASYLIGLIIIGSTIFQATGKAVQSFITSMSRATFFLLPSIFILPLYLALDGVWLAYPASDVLTFLLTFTLLIPQIKLFRTKSLEANRAPRRQRAG